MLQIENLVFVCLAQSVDYKIATWSTLDHDHAAGGDDNDDDRAVCDVILESSRDVMKSPGSQVGEMRMEMSGAWWEGAPAGRGGALASIEPLHP